MLRHETRGRARALQILYAWELQGAPKLHDAATGVAKLLGPQPRVFDKAEDLAVGVVGDVEGIDDLVARTSENWRMSRIAIIERNILRIAIHELRAGEPPAKVVIDEAVTLAKWFGGAKAPAFVNGLLDRIARDLGRL